MPGKTRQKKDEEKSSAQKNSEKKSNAEVCENEHKDERKGNWSEDQLKNSYYYDDSYGYEIYNAEEDDD